MRILSASIILPFLVGCVTPEEGDGAGGRCPIGGSSDWAAWVNAMPGPRQPTLIVTGRVTVPTGGYELALERGPVREIDPPIQDVILRVRPPAGPATQAIVTHDVRGQWPALDRYGAVVVRCGGETLAEIRPVERAY